MDFKPFQLSKKWKALRLLTTAVVFSLVGTGVLLAQPVPPVCGPGSGWIQNCAAGTDDFETSALVGLDLNPYDGFCFRELNLVLTPPPGNTDQILRSAPKDVITDPNILPPGPDCPVPTADGILDVIETEMVSLNITTGSGISLKAGSGSGAPVPATYGAIIEVPGNDSCGCSYFDVFFEVTTPCGPVYNHTPLRVKAIIKQVPPVAEYFHPTGLCLDLYPTPVGTPSWPVAQLVDALHLTQQAPIFGCTDPSASNYDPAATVDDGSCCFPVFGPGPGWFAAAVQGPPGTDELLTGANICVNLSPSNCVPVPADLELNLVGPTIVSRIPNPTGNIIQTEIIAMDLTGGDPLNPIQVRAGFSSSVPLPNSVGQILPNPDPFVAESFFDVFVEVEIPNPGGPPILGYNHNPVPLGAFIDQLPPVNPYDTEFLFPTGICIPIFDKPPGTTGAIPIGNIVKTTHAPKIVPGCTDPAALNYNPSATFNDGSCVYPAALCVAPSGTFTTNIFDNKALLRWNPVFGVTSYEITGRPCGGGPSTVVTITVPGTACEYLATGLLPSTCYEWVIAANGCPAFGCGLSPASPLNTFTTAPVCKAPAPIFSSNVTSSSAVLNWTNDGNCSSYRIYGRQVGTSPVTILTVPGGSSSFTATGLSSGTSYEWSVLCVCNSGETSGLAPADVFTTLGPASKSTSYSFGDNLTTSIYPNPANANVTISWFGIDINNEVDVMIYDINGRVIQSHLGMTATNNLQINTDDMPNGMYTVILKSQGETKVEKLIIAK